MEVPFRADPAKPRPREAPVAHVGAGLGVKMVRYSSLVRLFHPLLSAGFDRRFQNVPLVFLTPDPKN